ncbi:unnamed protein product [Didymodactylos carnosus]|uniref:Uncharacterized protein n=1 Tax=Didymodactylos carnosus TaxID=1234261 RepID=A0A813RYW6_9BILA|nr:unnamed protein product [Didymodactylos carnosus]CAF0787521.1 unnamed protein product [Didymodactylos carnosus]CAF3523356.1 unnamed protein product [Didymodactylos carnosus]CAF3571529.1 unnamed protein product [Didymodactylos carnosus]
MLYSSRKILCYGCLSLQRTINIQPMKIPFLLQRQLFSLKTRVTTPELTFCLFSPLKQRRHSYLNFLSNPPKRVFSFSAFCLQHIKSSTPTQTIIDDTANDPSISKTPFIFSPKSNDLKQKTNSSSSSNDDTSDEQKERAARAALDVKMLKYTAYFLGVWLVSTLGYIVLIWGSPQLDEEGRVIFDDYSHLPTWKQYLKRSSKGVVDYWQTIKDPTSDKLLPDPLHPSIQPLYTLVIEMSGILLNPEWTYGTGWRYKKRPGLDYFLNEVGYPIYEIVIYTKETTWAANSVIDTMDVGHKIMHRIFRENTRFIKGTHIKDLSCLNRDLKKIIFLDWDEAAYSLQPRNALHRLQKWDGDDNDLTLLHLATFLRMIAASGVEDVRDVLDHYNQENNPLEAFSFRQQQLLVSFEAEEQKRQAASAVAAIPTKNKMNVLEVPHEFFDVETKNLEYLYQAFCNYVYLGQWELSCVCLELLFNNRFQLKNSLEQLLIEIIKNPASYCIGSNSVSTPYHFALLLVQECQNKLYLETNLINTLKNDAVFRYLLAVGKIKPSVDVAQNFYRLHQIYEQLKNEDVALKFDLQYLLNDAMSNFLEQLWLSETSRAYSIIKSLYCKLTHEFFLHSHERALNNCINKLIILKTTDSDLQQCLYDQLLSLHLYVCDSYLKLTMKQTLKLILIYVVNNTLNENYYNLKSLYKSTIINGNLCKYISTLEAEHRMTMMINNDNNCINSTSIIMHFLNKNSFHQKLFWNDLYLYILENGKDLGLCVVQDALSMIQNRDYSSFDQLLGINEFSSLHIIIFLICWTNVRTLNDAIVLQDSIMSLNIKSSKLTKCLQLFQNHIEFISWLLTVRRADLQTDGMSTLLNISDLLSFLHANSPLSLIIRYLNINLIKPEIILEQLRKTCADIDDDNPKLGDTLTKKKVRFTDDRNSYQLSLSLSQTISTILFTGYLSIANVLQIILPPLTQIRNDDSIKLIKSYLNQLYPLRFRLEILENIFSLIFLQQNQLKIDETIITTTMPTTREQISLSSSDKYISASIRSHISNESLHVSITSRNNLSLDGQTISQNEADDDDEHLSIYSSSLSSVSNLTGNMSYLYKSGYLIDQNVLCEILLMLRDQMNELRTLYQAIQNKSIDRETNELETSLDQCFICSIKTDQFYGRLVKLNTIISEILWRYQLLIPTTVSSPDTIEEKNDIMFTSKNEERTQIFLKNLIIPLPKDRHKRRRKRRTRRSGSSSSSISSLQMQISANGDVSKILSTRENLLAICLKEEKMEAANEVIRIFKMESHPLAIEARFSQLFRNTIAKLNSASSSQVFVVSNTSPTIVATSSLNTLAELASSALGNTSIQTDVEQLVESCTTTLSTIPCSAYVEQEHYVALTLFDLSLSMNSLHVTKTLIDMALNYLPLFNTTQQQQQQQHQNKTNKSIKDMITNYSQLCDAYLFQQSHQSPSTLYPKMTTVSEMLCDATIPLNSTKALKTIQYLTRLDQYCKVNYYQQFIEGQSSLVNLTKSAADFFDNDQLKINILSLIKDNTNSSKLERINYFSIFYSYIQRFRNLLEKFPISTPSQSTINETYLLQNSPMSIISRIISKPDIDLKQLQIRTADLNIDISLTVTLNIIRPLLSTNTDDQIPPRTLLMEPIDIYSYKKQTTKQLPRRHSTFLKRLMDHLDDIQPNDELISYESSLIKHPDNIVRSLLTKLIDSIRKTLNSLSPVRTYFSFEHIDKLIETNDYDDILTLLPLLRTLDLNLLINNEQRLCFFINLHNLLTIVSHIELIRSTVDRTIYSKPFRNELEHLLFDMTTRIDIGCLKQLSLFELRYFILRNGLNPSISLLENFDFQLDSNDPILHYAPQVHDTKLLFILTNCTKSSVPIMILTPELIQEQLYHAVSDYVNNCVVYIMDKQILYVPALVYEQFINNTTKRLDKVELFNFISKYTHNDDLKQFLKEAIDTETSELNDSTTIPQSYKIQMLLPDNEFALNLDIQCCSPLIKSFINTKHRRTNSLPSYTSSLPSSFNVLTKHPSSHDYHLIDLRTIEFVKEKCPILGEILNIHLLNVVGNTDVILSSSPTFAPLQTYFSSLLLQQSILTDDWFRAVVLNDLSSQHDLLLQLCSQLSSESKWSTIIKILESLLPSFIVHSPYFSTLYDISLINLTRQQTTEQSYRYIKKIKDFRLLIRSTLTFMYKYNINVCISLLELCLTASKNQNEYTILIQTKLDEMSIYKVLCQCAKILFDKYLSRLASDISASDDLSELAIKKTSQKCLTWQSAKSESLRNSSAVADLFILEHQYDMAHKWYKYLNINNNIIKMKLIEEHISWLLKENDSDKIINVIQMIENLNDKWKLCSELIYDIINEHSTDNNELSSNQLQTPLSIPFARHFVKYRLIQYILENFNDDYFIRKDSQLNKSKLQLRLSGLSLFFNCIPYEQTDFYIQLIEYPLLIIEQLVMNASIDILKKAIEHLKQFIQKYGEESLKLEQKQIDQLIEYYAKQTVQLHVVNNKHKKEQIINDDSTLNSTQLQYAYQTKHRSHSGIQFSTPLERNDLSNSMILSPVLSQIRSAKTSADSSPFLLPNTNHKRERNSSQTSNSIKPTLKYSNDSSSTSSSSLNASPIPSNMIPIISSPLATTTDSIPSHSSSFLSNLSLSFSSRFYDRQTPPIKQTSQKTKTVAEINDVKSSTFIMPLVAPPKEHWTQDENISICMCCKQTQFSMFNRRHHCRRCGRVVCKNCSEQLTMIETKLERTCKSCVEQITIQNQQLTRTKSKDQEYLNNMSKQTEDRQQQSLYRTDIRTRSLLAFERPSIANIYLDKKNLIIKDDSSSISSTDYLLFGNSPMENNTFQTPLSMLSSNFNISPLSKHNTRTRIARTNYQQRTNTSSLLTKQNSNKLFLSKNKKDINNEELKYQLTQNLHDNKILREEFRYDQSPSISLCLSIIELHSDQYEIGKLLLKLCEELSDQLSSTTNGRNQEIDYGLVLNIIKNLLLTAKMKLMSNNTNLFATNHTLLSSCDMYINLIDILNRLNTANCDLPTLNDLLQPETLRRIRNKLLDDERYQLAIDISTRCNLDSYTIWIQWGMACLHIGQYTEARKKFEKCLKKKQIVSLNGGGSGGDGGGGDDDDLKHYTQRNISLITNTKSQQEKILNDIVNYLESCLPINRLIKLNYILQQEQRKPLLSIHGGLKYDKNLSLMPNINKQQYNQQQSEHFDEILYYLTNYGNDSLIIAFYLRHNLYVSAFHYFLKNKCLTQIFLDDIFLPLLKCGQIEQLLNFIQNNNNNINMKKLFQLHLKQTSIYLKEQKYFHSLKQLQLFMNDYLNVSYTYIDLYLYNRKNYKDLYENRLDFLQKSYDYFELYQQQQQQNKDFLIMTSNNESTLARVHSYKAKILLQIDVTRFIYTQIQRLDGNDGSNIFVNCPTLFAKNDIIVELLVGLLIISDTVTNVFNLMNRIIKEFTLSPSIVFTSCAKQIGKKHDYRLIAQLLTCLRENGYNETKLHDEIIDSCIRQIGSDVEQSKEQDGLIQMIKNDDVRINAYIFVGKLRAAYLIAIRLGKEDTVRLILNNAQRTGQTAVKDICSKWLENRTKEQ